MFLAIFHARKKNYRLVKRVNVLNATPWRKKVAGEQIHGAPAESFLQAAMADLALSGLDKVTREVQHWRGSKGRQKEWRYGCRDGGRGGSFVGGGRGGPGYRGGRGRGGGSGAGQWAGGEPRWRCSVLAHDCEGNMPGFSSCCIYRCKIV